MPDVCLKIGPSYSENVMDQPNDLKREAFYIEVITLEAEKYFKYDIKNYVDIGGCLKTAKTASICIILLIIHSPIEYMWINANKTCFLPFSFIIPDIQIYKMKKMMMTVHGNNASRQ